MQILNQNLNKTISKNFSFPFNAPEAGIYLIEIIASCKNWRQNWAHFFNDDDLAVKINNIEFSKLNKKNGLLNGEAAWNGNNLKGAKKIGIFVLNLKSGDHQINFIPNTNPKIHSINIAKVENNIIEYVPAEENRQAEDGNNRQWISIALADLPLKELKITAKAEKRKKDSDDIKLIIDGEIQKNPDSKKFKNWHWSGSSDDGKEKEFRKEINLSKGLHYIELWTDRTLVLDKIILDLGEESENDSKEYPKAKIIWESVKLRKDPEINDQNVLAEIRQGEELAVLEKATQGERPKNNSGVLLSSNRWHKIKYSGQEGYIYSEALEIEGESKEEIYKIIIQESKKLDLDPEILLALSNCESQFFPYTVSYDEKLPEIAFGVMQISNDLSADLNDPGKSIYNPFGNIFDIEKNIQGGIKYFEYLYNGKYKDDSDRLRKTIAAYNAGPRNVSADKPLNLNLHENQTKRLVNCVLDRLNKGIFKDIIKKFLPVLILTLACYSMFFLKQKSNKNSNIQAGLFSEENVYAPDNIKSDVFSKAIWSKEDKTISFFDKNGIVKGEIESKRLQIDELFQIPPDVTSDDSIHIDSEIIEYPENIFYFLASTFYMCGAQNCTWVLYKYNTKNDFLQMVDDDIFGSVSLFPSPDYSKIAILRNVHGGYCNNGGYISIIDLSNFNKNGINDFNESYNASYMDSLEWKDNNRIAFEIIYTNCGLVQNKKDLKETLEYNSEGGILREISSILIEWEAGSG